MAPPPGRIAAAAEARTAAPRRDAPPRLEVVRQPRRLRPGLVGTLVIGFVFATLLAVAAMQAVLVQGQLRLDELQTRIDERSAEVERLGVQVATLASPGRIRDEAVRAGLVEPPEVVYLSPALVEPLTDAERPGAEDGAGDGAEDGAADGAGDGGTKGEVGP